MKRTQAELIAIIKQQTEKVSADEALRDLVITLVNNNLLTESDLTTKLGRLYNGI